MYTLNIESIKSTEPIDSPEILPVLIVHEYPSNTPLDHHKNLSYYGKGRSPRGHKIQYEDGTLKINAKFFQTSKPVAVGETFPYGLQEKFGSKTMCVTLPSESKMADCYATARTGIDIGHLFISDGARWVCRFEVEGNQAKVTAVYDKHDFTTYDLLDIDHLPTDVLKKYVKEKDSRIIPYLMEAITIGNIYMSNVVSVIKSIEDIHILEWLRDQTDGKVWIQDGFDFAIRWICDELTDPIPVLDWCMESSGLVFDYPDFLMRNLGSHHGGRYEVMTWFAEKFGSELKFKEDAIDCLLNTRYISYDDKLAKPIAIKSLNWWVNFSKKYGVPLKYSYGKNCWWFNDAYTDEYSWKKPYTKFLKQFPAKEYIEDEISDCE